MEKKTQQQTNKDSTVMFPAWPFVRQKQMQNKINLKVSPKPEDIHINEQEKRKQKEMKRRSLKRDAEKCN